MNANETKRIFADALLALCETQDVSKVNASMIIAKSGKNRNTFYYHFEDKATLLLWIFRRDLGEKLLKGGSELSYDYEGAPKPFCPLPFYAREITGIRSVDTSYFMKSTIAVIIARREFYRQAFESDWPFIRSRLVSLFTQSIERDLEIVLGGRQISPADKRLIVSYHANGLAEFIKRLPQLQERELIESRMSRFLNLIPDSLSYEVENRRF